MTKRKAFIRKQLILTLFISYKEKEYLLRPSGLSSVNLTSFSLSSPDSLSNALFRMFFILSSSSFGSLNIFFPCLSNSTDVSMVSNSSKQIWVFWIYLTYYPKPCSINVFSNYIFITYLFYHNIQVCRYLS